MRHTIATFVALFVTVNTFAQGGFYAPFTDVDAQLLSAVWPEIRRAERYEDISWPAHGLSRAPGSREVQRTMSLNWYELRQAARFEQIDWDEVIDGRELRGQSYRFEDRTDRLEQRLPGPYSEGAPYRDGGQYSDVGPFRDNGPFTRDEAEIMSQLWPQIRESAAFGDINWRVHGLDRAPGDADARRLLAFNWNEARRAARFEDIHWSSIMGERELRTSRERQYAGGYGGRDSANPFTREEGEIMSAIWRRIRTAADFRDIDWRSVGLSGPPGSREARRLMDTHWAEFSEAAQFEDIRWSATVGARRVLW